MCTTRGRNNKMSINWSLVNWLIGIYQKQIANKTDPIINFSLSPPSRAVLIGSEEPQQIQCWQMTPLFARRRLVCSQQQPTALTSRQLQTWEENVGLQSRQSTGEAANVLMPTFFHQGLFFPKQTTIKKSEWKNVYRVLN